MQGLTKFKDRTEEKKVESVRALIYAFRERPHLGFSVLNKLPLEQLHKLTRTNSELQGILEKYCSSAPKHFIGHQLSYQRMQWFHGFPELEGNELEFDIDVIANDNPVEYLHKRLLRVQLDEHGAVMVVKSITGHLILLTNYDLTEKTVISIEPNPCNYIRVYRSSKFICVTNYGSTGRALVYCRQTGEKLYTFRGNVGSKILDNVLDEVYVREYNRPILSIFKFTKTRAISVYETTGCCGIKSLKLNIMPSSSGLIILSFCISCWKAKKSVLQTRSVIWELQIKPKIKNPEDAVSILDNGVFILENCTRTQEALEKIFIDPEIGCVIEIDHHEHGRNLRHLISKQFIILAWQQNGYLRFSVYDRNARQVTKKFQVMTYPTEKIPWLNLVQERILVVTHRVPERFHRVRIIIFDIHDQEPETSMRIISDTYKYLRPTDQGLLEISANHWGTLTICRKHFKVLDTKEKEKMLHAFENVSI